MYLQCFRQNSWLPKKATPISIASSTCNSSLDRVMTSEIYRVVFLTGPANFQYQNEKRWVANQSFNHEILYVQKIFVGWTTFFFLALKFGRTSKKPHCIFRALVKYALRPTPLARVQNESVAKGTTDPRVEFISQVQTQILIKFQNFDQASTSKSQPNTSLSIKL